MQINHWYCEEDGNIYYHGAREEHKIDAISKCDKMSLCVNDKGFRKEDEWALNVDSVIVFGRIIFVENIEKARSSTLFTVWIRTVLMNNIRLIDCNTAC